MTLLENPTKEFSYFLGYLWADGYLTKSNGISLEIVSTDCNVIKSSLYTLGNFNFNERHRKEKDGCNRKPITNIQMSNVFLKDFLLKFNYKNKSTENFSKIYEWLPCDLKHYFLRGLIDGDGCIYLNHKNHSYQFHISSTIDQDWSYLTSIFNSLGLTFTITKRIQKRTQGVNKSSKIQITNVNSILKLLEFVYTNYNQDSIGLSRKYEKFQEIKNRAQIKNKNKK